VIQNIPRTHEFHYAGIGICIYHASKGEGLAKHNHTFTHANMVLAGKVLLRKEGVEIVADKFTQPVNLKPVEWHEIEVIEDNTVWVNIFASKYSHDNCPDMLSTDLI